jgi:16S rRNA (uracil1498-N3)-methyltransferase
VVERDRRASVATFYLDTRLAPGAIVTPSDDVRHHLRVRRCGDGDAVRLTDGAGHLAAATLRANGGEIELVVSAVTDVERERAIHLCAPVADRDRMLWLGEKASELEVATWRSVRFRRSASVTPRGEGENFVAKLRARMISALEQSGGAWLPAISPESDVASISRNAAEVRIVMDARGEPLASVLGSGAATGVTLLAGPEGGIEDDELALLEQGGWRRARLGRSTLRFETAAIAAIAVVRAALSSRES